MYFCMLIYPMMDFIRILIFILLLFDWGSEVYGQIHDATPDYAISAIGQNLPSSRSFWKTGISTTLTEEANDSDDLERLESLRTIAVNNQEVSVLCNLVFSQIYREEFIIFGTDTSPPVC